MDGWDRTCVPSRRLEPAKAPFMSFRVPGAGRRHRREATDEDALRECERTAQTSCTRQVRVPFWRCLPIASTVKQAWQQVRALWRQTTSGNAERLGGQARPDSLDSAPCHVCVLSSALFPGLSSPTRRRVFALLSPHLSPADAAQTGRDFSRWSIQTCPWHRGFYLGSPLGTASYPPAVSSLSRTSSMPWCGSAPTSGCGCLGETTQLSRPSAARPTSSKVRSQWSGLFPLQPMHRPAHQGHPSDT